jgi:hypothetical protein
MRDHTRAVGYGKQRQVTAIAFFALLEERLHPHLFPHIFFCGHMNQII